MAQYPIGRSTTGSYIELPAASVGALLNYDTVIAVYKDTTTITVKAGGQFTVGGTLHTVAADFDLSVSSDLTTDDTLTALTWYHVITNGTDWKFSDATTCSDVTGGVALKIGVSIWDSSGLKVRQFTYNGQWYRYLHNAILLYDAAMPTVNQTIALAAYVPSQVRCVELRSFSTYYNSASITDSGVYINDVLALPVNGIVFPGVGAGHAVIGVFWGTTARTFSFRCSPAFPGGKLYLQAWSV